MVERIKRSFYFSVNVIKPSKKALDKRQNPNSQSVENYLRLTELMRMQKAGAIVEEMKQYSINRTRPDDDGGSNKGEKKASYKRLLGKGNLDQRLRAIVSYKRNNIAAENAMNERKRTKTENIAKDDEDIENDDDDRINEDDKALFDMMESTEGDEEYRDEDDEDGDNEEAVYESLVLQALEQNKRSQMQTRLVGEAKWDELSILSKQNCLISSSSSSTSTTKTENTNKPDNRQLISLLDDDKDTNTTLYTPKVSTWGVYQRPHDISKAYGGGRAITKEEIDALDEEADAKEMAANKRVTNMLQALVRTENEQKEKITDALARARGLLSVGERLKAVEALEAVRAQVTYTSEFGGEVMLELAMALETIDDLPEAAQQQPPVDETAEGTAEGGGGARGGAVVGRGSDEARKIYGRLVQDSWSPKIRKQAFSLLSGLEITRKIRKDSQQFLAQPAGKPLVNPVHLAAVTRAINDGLLVNNDDQQRQQRRRRELEAAGYLPWMGEDGSLTDQEQALQELYKVTTFIDAYRLLVEYELDVFGTKKVPAEVLTKVFRRFYLMMDSEEKMNFVKRRIPFLAAATGISGSSSSSDDLSSMISSSRASPRNTAAVPPSVTTSIFLNNNSSSSSNSVMNSNSNSNSMRTISSMFYDGNDEPVSTISSAFNGMNNKKQYTKPMTKKETMRMFLNGTWDLVTSLYDISPYQAVRYESGQVRRRYLVEKQVIEESTPTFWGMMTTTNYGSLQWKAEGEDVNIVGEEGLDGGLISIRGEDLLKRSLAPWQKRDGSDFRQPAEHMQTLQVVYVDDRIQITRQVNRKRVRDPDLYVLWKRVKENNWNRY